MATSSPPATRPRRRNARRSWHSHQYHRARRCLIELLEDRRLLAAIRYSDFGDAPAPYPTLAENEGALHLASASGPFLGSVPPDGEPDGQPSADALGDDNSEIDDEDASMLLVGDASGEGQTLPGESYTATLTVNGTGWVSAWVDWNGNGSWNDPGEQIVADAFFGAERLFASPIEDPEDEIVELNPLTGDELNRFEAPDVASLFTGLAYDGSSLWYTEGHGTGELFELDPDTGEVLDADPLPTGLFDSLATLNGLVYAGNFDGSDTIIEFDPVTDTVTNTLEIGTEICCGLAGIKDPDRLLAIATDGNIIEIDPATGEVTSSFEVEASFRHDGIAVIGGEIYLASADPPARFDVYSRAGELFGSADLPYFASGLGGDDVASHSQTVVLNGVVPTDAVPGDTYVRVRVSTQAELGPTGAAPDGEVEDHLVTILEGTTPCNLVVTNTNDSGPGSLREAIHCANNTPGLNTISFNVPTDDAGHVYYLDDGVSDQVTFDSLGTTTAADDSSIADIDPDYPHSWYRIQPASGLPLITDPVVIDGYTQAGAQANTNSISQPINTVLRIELNGDNLPDSPRYPGLYITVGGSTVQGLAVNQFRYAPCILIESGSGNVVQGSFLGMLISGTSRVSGGDGVRINGSADNLVGGTEPAARNLIAGYGGVHIEGTSAEGNVIQGNFMGLDRTGSRDAGGVAGVYIESPNNLVGGSSESARNVISGDHIYGVQLEGTSAYGNRVQGNFIGTDRRGILRRGNRWAGVFINGGSNNVIGAPLGAAPNGYGNVINDNQVGVWVRGESAIGNTILANSIYDNNVVVGQGPGIRLGGILAGEDSLDADTGPNNNQNFPVLTYSEIRDGQFHVEGTLHSTPNSTFLIELFTNYEDDVYYHPYDDIFLEPWEEPTGYGEGQRPIGTIEVTTNDEGNVDPPFAFTGPIAFDSQNDHWATATATNVATGDTSQFSQALEINWARVTFEGRKFRDLDAEGPGADGPGVAGVRIDAVTPQGNTRLSTYTMEDDPATPDVDETGFYRLAGLWYGTWTIVERPEPGFYQTYPAEGAYTFELTPGETVQGVDFGNAPIEIGGEPMITASKVDALLVDNDGDERVDPGDTIRYTISINNSGDATAHGVILSDTPDENTSLVIGSVTTTQGTVTTGDSSGDTTAVVDIGELAAETGMATITFDVIVNDPFPPEVTSVSNQGTITGIDFDTVVTGVPTETMIDVTAPRVAAHKVDALLTDNDGDGRVDPGDTIRYTITMNNSGDGDANQVMLSDTPDMNTTLVIGSVTTSQGTVMEGDSSGDTSVTVDVGTLAAEIGMATITFDVIVNDPLPPGVTSVSNQGTVTGIDFETVVTGVPTETIIDVTAPQVLADKVDVLLTDIDGDGRVDPGDTIRYTITINNSGDGDAKQVLLTDTPDENTTLIIGSVTTTQGTVTAGDSSGDTSVIVDVGTLAAETGRATITFDVIVNDPFPAGVTSVSNQGTVTGIDFETVVTGVPTETIIDVTAPQISADKLDALLTDIDGDSRVDPGDTIRYTITISNSGDADAKQVLLSDTPDVNTTLVIGSVTTTQGTVTEGDSSGDTSVIVDVGTLIAETGIATITFDVIVNDPFPVGVTSVSNQGTVTGIDFETVVTGVPTETIIDVTAAEISASKVDGLLTDHDGDGRVDPGDTIRYTINISNSGDADANGVLLSDTPDVNTTLVIGSVTTTQGSITEGDSLGDTAVIVDVGTLAAETGMATVTFDVVVHDPFPASVTTVSNQGTVTGIDFETVVTGDPTETMIDVSADLSLTKTVSDARPNVGDEITFTLMLDNQGPNAATGVTVIDVLPTGLMLLDASTGNYNRQTGAWTIANLPAGGTEVLTINALVRAPDAVTNMARVSALDQRDPDTADNEASVSVTPQIADLSLVKTVDTSAVQVGQQVTFTIALNNAGPDEATGVTVTDLLPSGLTFVRAEAETGDYDEDEGLWDVGRLDAGTTTTLDIVATLGSQSVRNTAEVATSDQFDPDPDDNQFSVGIGACLTGGPLTVGMNRLVYSCVTPGGFAPFVMGTQLGSYHYGDYGMTVEIADPHVMAIGVGNRDGVATVMVEVPEDYAGHEMMFQAMEMMPHQRLSNVLKMTTSNDLLGSPLRAADFGVGGEPLSDSSLPALTAAAVARWEASGLSAADSRLIRSMDVRISDLPGDQLAASHGNFVLLDSTAAGNGWFVDVTPGENSEFASDENGQHVASGPAANHIDALTALMHELGHALDYPDLGSVSSQLMSRQLPVGIRRLPAFRYDPLDINRDRKISALDASLVINALGRTQGAAGEYVMNRLGEAGNEYDANRDGTVSALDALQIINRLSEVTAEPEAEYASTLDAVIATPDRSAPASEDDDELLDLLAADLGTLL